MKTHSLAFNQNKHQFRLSVDCCLLQFSFKEQFFVAKAFCKMQNLGTAGHQVVSLDFIILCLWAPTNNVTRQSCTRTGDKTSKEISKRKSHVKMMLNFAPTRIWPDYLGCALKENFGWDPSLTWAISEVAHFDLDPNQNWTSANLKFCMPITNGSNFFSRLEKTSAKFGS